MRLLGGADNTRCTRRRQRGKRTLQHSLMGEKCCCALASAKACASAFMAAFLRATSGPSAPKQCGCARVVVRPRRGHELDVVGQSLLGVVMPRRRHAAHYQPAHGHAAASVRHRQRMRQATLAADAAHRQRGLQLGGSCSMPCLHIQMNSSGMVQEGLRPQATSSSAAPPPVEALKLRQVVNKEPRTLHTMRSVCSLPPSCPAQAQCKCGVCALHNCQLGSAYVATQIHRGPNQRKQVVSACPA
jgi:hypothetical protein